MSARGIFGGEDRSKQALKDLVLGTRNPMALLKAVPETLSLKRAVRDNAGRYFSNISPWEYMLWSGDVDGYGIQMLFCLRTAKEGEQPNQLLINLRQRLKTQYKLMNSGGIEYTCNGVSYTSHHYDYTDIIAALRAFMDLYVKDDIKIEEKDEQWLSLVQEMRKNIPVNLRQDGFWEDICLASKYFESLSARYRPIAEYVKPSEMTDFIQYCNDTIAALERRSAELHTKILQFEMLMDELAPTPVLAADVISSVYR